MQEKNRMTIGSAVDRISTSTLSFAATLAAMTTTFLLSASAAEVKGRSWDVLRDEGVRQPADAAPLAVADAKGLSRRQLPLCMIGDSVTWAEQGDYWRRYLIEAIPELAFVGTHSGRIGYSHAGEGGDSTYGVLSRVDKRDRVPDCPYYHLMIGINDASAARTAEQIDSVASNIVLRTEKIVKALLARKITRKVFLASILPGPFDPVTGEPTMRDRAGSRANAMMRSRFSEMFPDGRVVYVEYERPLREKSVNWNSKELMSGPHPTKKGYRMVADFLAATLRREMEPVAPGSVNGGVEVVNLWNDGQRETAPLIPGWYVLSFELLGKSEASVPVRLWTECDNPKLAVDRRLVARRNGDGRYEAAFMTGYERYTYTERPFRLELPDDMKPVKVQVEKMRPSGKASTYGMGVHIDAASEINCGEAIR